MNNHYYCIMIIVLVFLVVFFAERQPEYNDKHLYPAYLH